MDFIDRLRNSKRYPADVRTELTYEFLERTSAGTPGFFMAAAWVVYSRLEMVKYADITLILGVYLLVINFVRYFILRRTLETQSDLNRTVQIMNFVILTNTVAWSVLGVLSIVEFRYTNSAAAISAFGMVLGLTFSSLATLSVHLGYAYYFQWSLLLPSAFLSYVVAMQDENRSAFTAAVIITISFLYLIGQTRSLHHQTVKRIRYHLDLDKANKLLTKSRGELIEEKAKLQHSIRLAAVGEISGEIAHEINNPLGLIVGHLELAYDEVASKTPNLELVKGKLEKARSAISRITKIIKGLRHYSRSTANDPLVATDINEIIYDAVEFCSEKLSYHRIDFEMNNEIDAEVNCRPVEISQVLLNVFTNAIDEVCRLPIGERHIFLKTELINNFIRISVTNSGAKIPENIRDKIFEPFFSTKKVGIGTGLGLSISREIIERYGGKLYLDLQQPQTTFAVELPTVS